MSYLVREKAITASEKIISFYPDLSYISFTAKAQKTKTRKGKDYFILRITIPKDAAEQMGASPDDILLIRAKKALWYHMMDWNEMEPAWEMLPQEVKSEVIMAGLPNPDSKSIESLTGLQGNLTGIDPRSWNSYLSERVPLLTSPTSSTGGK